MSQKSSPLFKEAVQSAHKLLKLLKYPRLVHLEKVVIVQDGGCIGIGHFAGLVEAVHYAFLITDSSKRGVDTCVELKKAMERIDSMKNCGYEVIINKSETVPEKHMKYLKEERIEVLGAVPLDAMIAEADSEGVSLLSLPPSPAYNAVAGILDTLMS